MNKEELEEKIDKLQDEVHEIWEKSFDRKDGWEWYSTHPKLKELVRLERELRLVKDYTLRDIKGECGHLMTLESFAEACRVGPLFIDSDGCGEYAFKDKVSDLSIYPSDITSGVYRKDFTHIMWYNK